MGVKSKGHSFISSMGKKLPQGMTRSSKPNLTTEPSMFYKLFQRIFKWFCRHVFPVVVLYALHYTAKYFLTCHLSQLSSWCSSGISPGLPSFYLIQQIPSPWVSSHTSMASIYLFTLVTLKSLHFQFSLMTSRPKGHFISTCLFIHLLSPPN